MFNTEEYTPTTEIVRYRYATYMSQEFLSDTALIVHGPEFDRWLAAHDAEVLLKLANREGE